ncbi:MAG: exopolyphosphatase [Spirochaetales bacterium]
MGDETAVRLDAGPYRLVTQSDFDGVVSAALLRSLGIIEQVKFVHPRDVQNRLIELGDRDISSGLPFIEGVAAAFNHQLSESLRNGNSARYICDPHAPSSARVIWNHFGGRATFSSIPDDLMDAVDKSSSGNFTKDEVLHATGWSLLYFVIDARTGLGRFATFRISNQQLMIDLTEYCLELEVDEILALPDVAERVQLYRQHEERFAEQIKRCSTVWHNVLVVDLTGEDEILPGNRYVKYALFDEVNVSVQIMWGFERQYLIIMAAKSIFDKTCSVNIGALMKQQGGGGHADAGTCQVPTDDAPKAVEQIVRRLSVIDENPALPRYRYPGPG